LADFKPGGKASGPRKVNSSLDVNRYRRCPEW